MNTSHNTNTDTNKRKFLHSYFPMELVNLKDPLPDADKSKK